VRPRPCGSDSAAWVAARAQSGGIRRTDTALPVATSWLHLGAGGARISRRQAEWDLGFNLRLPKPKVAGSRPVVRFAQIAWRKGIFANWFAASPDLEVPGYR
jgi:hypothetical protein